MAIKRRKTTPADRKIQEDLRKLVMARIKASSGDLRLSIGGTVQSYTKEELLKSVEKGDEIGKEIINIQLEYLKDMAQGKIYKFEYDTDNKTKS